MIRSGAYPHFSSAENITHYFALAIPDCPFQQLLIYVPDLIDVGDVNVTDHYFSGFPHTVSITPLNIAIAFTQPLLPKSQLIVLMKNIRIAKKQSAGTWRYPIYGVHTHTLNIQRLGTAQVRTYPS